LRGLTAQERFDLDTDSACTPHFRAVKAARQRAGRLLPKTGDRFTDSPMSVTGCAPRLAMGRIPISVIGRAPASVMGRMPMSVTSRARVGDSSASRGHFRV
jgi:hypothetical protein